MPALDVERFPAPAGVLAYRKTLVRDDGASYRIFNLAHVHNAWREVGDGSETHRVFVSVSSGERWVHHFALGERRDMTGHEGAVDHQLLDAQRRDTARGRLNKRNPALGSANAKRFLFDDAGVCWEYFYGGRDVETAVDLLGKVTIDNPQFRYFLRDRNGPARMLCCYLLETDEDRAAATAQQLQRQVALASIVSPPLPSELLGLSVQNAARFHTTAPPRGTWKRFREPAP